jgi:hypothetical protein
LTSFYQIILTWNGRTYCQPWLLPPGGAKKEQCSCLAMNILIDGKGMATRRDKYIACAAKENKLLLYTTREGL